MHGLGRGNGLMPDRTYRGRNPFYVVMNIPRLHHIYMETLRMLTRELGQRS